MLPITFKPSEVTITANAAKPYPLFEPIQRVQCPRCKGAGSELLFMSYSTCEVCHGVTTVPVETARAEIDRREADRERYR